MEILQTIGEQGLLGLLGFCIGVLLALTLLAKRWPHDRDKE